MTKILVISFLLSLIVCTLTQQNGLSLGDALNNFASNLLRVTAEEAGNDMNLALSPYTVWSLLSIIAEGSRGNTARELEISLNIPSEKTQFRKEYKSLQGLLQKKTPNVTLELSSGIFTNKKHPLKQSFQRRTKEFYDADIMPVDFKNLKTSTEFINNYISKATNNRIPDLISPDDLRDAEIFLTSTLYFKGDWQNPFNQTATKKAPFFNEKGTEIAQVNMMYLSGFVPFLRLEALKSQAVLLRYGDGSKMAMVVILPMKGSSVSEVLSLMNKMPMRTILEKLREAEQQFVDEDVNVYLPKFSISSDLNLNIALDKLGIKDVFDSQKADLLDMVSQYLYISRFVQKAEIVVNEEGTEASAAAGASAIYKQQSPKFMANRPFIYYIVDSQARSVIFNGVYRNPKTALN